MRWRDIVRQTPESPGAWGCGDHTHSRPPCPPLTPSDLLLQLHPLKSGTENAVWQLETESSTPFPKFLSCRVIPDHTALEAKEKVMWLTPCARTEEDRAKVQAPWLAHTQRSRAKWFRKVIVGSVAYTVWLHSSAASRLSRSPERPVLTSYLVASTCAQGSETSALCHPAGDPEHWGYRVPGN